MEICTSEIFEGVTLKSLSIAKPRTTDSGGFSQTLETSAKTLPKPYEITTGNQNEWGAAWNSHR